MANTREIKLRIKGINETKKITKAMKLISASKLKKARALLNETLPFFEKVQDTIDDILAHTEEFTSVYLDHRPNKPNKKKAYIVIASDKGLTGGYNHNLLKYAEDMMDKENAIVYPIGIIVADYMEKAGYEVQHLKEGHVTDIKYSRDIADLLIRDFKKGKIDEVYVVYTLLESAIRFTPSHIQLLPLDKEEFNTEADNHNKYKCEPSPEMVFDALAAKYVKGVLYGAMIESYTSEHSARMNAMDSATANADKIIKQLTLNYNRARQAAITQEINEIVSGAGL